MPAIDTIHEICKLRCVLSKTIDFYFPRYHDSLNVWYRRRRFSRVTTTNAIARKFLSSLRAGGSGLTLTAADTVIHYDPWWNPQVENQATDRAYRIGRDKPVFVYKLIARGTIEERIVELQKKKGELARDILDFKSKKAASGLIQDDLNLLLSPAEFQPSERIR